MNAIKDITISSSAVLVSLTIKGWSAQKTDREVSEEVSAAKSAQASNAGKYQKNLLAGCVELEVLQKSEAAIRHWFRQYTLPWSDSGLRLLPAARMQDFMQKIGELEKEHRDKINALQTAYGLAVQSAQFSLGSMFRAGDYPDVAEIPNKFQFSYSFYPLPESGDFRVDIGNEGLSDLRQRFEKENSERTAQSMDELKERMKKSLLTLSNQLRVEKDGKKGRMHQSTVDTALELCATMQDYNLVRDPELDALAKDFSTVLNGYDLADCKKDEVVRGYMKAELDALADKFSLV